MPKIYTLHLNLFLFLLCSGITAQTSLYPGDITVVAIAADMGACGLPPQSDEISFVCFQDIETGTTIEITDNGWETQYPGFWGTAEGTLSMTRTGGGIPKGTVITLQAMNNPGGWIYRTISPDNGWAITNVNVPGGPFNIEIGGPGFNPTKGDQVYFMQGGTWDNQGGGTNKGIYDGNILFGFNTFWNWTADGSTQHSNLHPDVASCYHFEQSPNTSYIDFQKFADLPFSPEGHVDWLSLTTATTYWYTFDSCTQWNSFGVQYHSGYSIEVDDDMKMYCLACHGCQAPFQDGLKFDLPPGNYNVVYTDGTDTFEIQNIQNGYYFLFDVIVDMTFTLISVEEVGGCKVYSPFGPPAVIDNIGRDPGLYAELWLCPNYIGSINLFNYLNGTPETGGTWFSENPPGLGGNLPQGIITAQYGQGLFTYKLFHPHPPQPPPFPNWTCEPNFDSASVRIHFVDPSLSTLEVGCDQNGTPNDIFDDRITVTLNFLADTFITNYYVFVNGGGSVTPNSGVAGEPTVFYLDPGTAMGPDLQLTVQGQGPFNCNFKFPIPSPGFCSDPCDYDMTSSVSGTEELCVKNCPENPGYFNVDVFGGTEPYKMGFSLFAPGYPAWNFPGIPIEQFNQIEVCIAEVPAPTFNPVTNFLTIPQFLGGSELTFTLLEVTDKYDCTSQLTNEEHTITIHPLPVLNPTSFEVCKEFDRFFNLTDLDPYINAGLDIVWYEGDPLNGGDKIFFPTAVNLENISTLWAYTKDDHCENSIQIPFTILPSPKIDSIDALQVCYGNPVVLADIEVEDLGFSDPVYTFHPGAPFDLTNEIVPPSFIPSESTTIYVLATAGICFDTMPIEINVLDYPDFTLQGQPCNLIAGTYSILFSSTAASIISSAGVVFNNSTGPDSIVGIPNNVNVSIELLGAFNLCRDTFMIVAPNCNCPFIAPPVASQINVEICEGSALPLLSVQNSPGFVTNWYDVPSGGIPILQNSLTFQPVNPVNATYYVEAFDPNSACYSIRTQINLVINPVANLQALGDPQLCALATIDFNSFSPGVLNGVSGVGQWFNLATHLPVSGVIQPQNGNAWYYLFTSAQGICISSDTIQAIVHQSPVIDAFDIICNEALLTYDVSFTSDADIVVPSVGALSNIPGTDTFLLSNIPFDTNIQFDIQNSITGCTASISQLAPNCSCPALLQNSNTKLCSDQGDVNLSAFEGAGVNGNWQLVSTPPGSNPATLSGSNFQGQNADPGLYVLRFIRSVILSDCVDTATFDLQLNESPFVDAGSNAVVCAPDAITLSGSAGGDNIVFSWQENGAATISNPNALNTNYTPTLADITAGSVSFTLSAVDQTGFCPDASETIVMTIDDRAYFILNAPSQNYCDTADLQINFDDLISFGNTGGEWFFPDTVSAPIVGSSMFNPSTLSIGNYTVFYTTTNAVAPCKNDTVGVNLIIEDCACPSVALSLPTQGVCSESAVQELNDFLITSEQGSWSITGTPPGTKPAILNGTKFTTNNSDAGFYRLRFTLANPKAGCDDFAEINLEVIPTPTVQIVSAVCAGDLQSWEVIIISSAGSILNSQGNLTDLGNDRYRIDGLTLLTSLQVSASNGNGLCTSNTTIAAPDCACTLNISNLPDEVSLCPNETITLEATVNGAKGTVTNFWIVANDSLYQSSLVISTAGQYHFVSLDELGCRQEKFVDVLYYTEMVPDASVVDITCPGDQDGQIILHNIIGGSGPYFISINGGNMQPVSVFPHTITGLNAGNYKIDLLDGFSCSISFNLMVESVSAETLNLGPDQTILVGDSVQINPILSFTPDNFSWTGDVGVIDPLLLNQWIKPEVDQSYVLVAFDSKGCRYSDDLKIRVLLESSIFIPNVFSPNDDQINDLLAPLTDPSIIEIDYFEIFSRWGEMVYSEKKFPPNQPNFGWDGKLRGQHMMPGVFVYRISATNKKGKVIQQAGDITLLR